MSGIPGTAFVGRTAELDVLNAHLAAARSGHSRIVCVEGAAGIGKSALIGRFLAGAGAVVTLRAGGDEDEQSLAWGIVGQLARSAGPHTGRLPMDLRRVPPSTGHLQVGTWLLDTLGALQRANPVCVIVEDLHWADDPSARALLFALRRLVHDAVLAVLTRRPEHATRMDEAWRRLLGDARATTVRLAGMQPDELAALAVAVRKPLTPCGARALHEHTGGNPLHALALLDELGPEAISRSTALLPAPRSLATLTVARLSRCSPPCQALVTAAAVLGSSCPLADAARVARVRNPAGPLREAVHAGLLVETSGLAGRDVRFPHQLLRAAIYHDLAPGRRAALHTAAARCTTGAARLAHAVAAAMGPDERLARTLEAQAAEEAARGGFGAAARHLYQAAHFTERVAARHRCLYAAVELWLASGDLSATDAALGAVDELPPGPRRSCLRGALALFAGRFADAEAELANAWRGVSDARDQTTLAATVATYLAVLATARLSHCEMVAWAERALALGGARAEVVALAWWARSWGLASSGRADQALREFDAVASSGVLGDIDALWIRGQLAVWCDDFPRAAGDLEACLARVGDARGDRSLLACVAACLLCQALYRLGRFAEAIQQVELGLAVAQQAGRSVDFLFIHAMAAYPRIARGDWDAAAAHVREALAHGRALGAPGTMAYATAAAARLAAARGDHEEVLRAIATLPDPRGPWEQSLLPVGDLAVEASLALGRVDEAEAHLAALEAAPTARRPLGHAMIARARGAIEAARGRPAAARTRFEEALGHLRGLSVPLEEARVQLDLGRVLRRSGDRAGARRHIVAARDTFAALGARPDLAAAERELPATSAGQPRAARLGTLALSPQEAVVARLVAGGKSNRQVAADLFVTVKTVEYHLGNIYAKLGIFSRAQLREQVVEPATLAPVASMPAPRAASAGAPNYKEIATNEEGDGGGEWESNPPRAPRARRQF